jgi:ABC-2 type transport system permease protein
LKKFLAIVQKEYLLLIRDIPALATLFVMPAILLIIVTLSQEGASLKEKSGMKIILVNADSSILGDTIVYDIIKSASFNVTKFASAREAQESVIRGTYQLAVIIPDSATEKLIRLVKVNYNNIEDENLSLSGNLAGILFIYDPAVQKMYKDAVFGPLKMAIHLSALKVLMGKYGEIVKKNNKDQYSELDAAFSSTEFKNKIPDFPYRDDVIKKFRDEILTRVKQKQEQQTNLPVNPLFLSEILEIHEEIAVDESSKFKPNPLQNNVPAFTLFAMFFIVIPLAGSILSEKNLGVYDRLRTLPVSYLKIISAKIVVFLIVCICQFILLMCIGSYLMPVLSNLPTLNMNVNYPALFLALIASGLAATGFGIIVGTIAETHGQAATFGSVLVVILAMLGGIFVPVHMLPETLKKISMISPLRWGTDAFLGVFARSEGISRIWSELFLLIGFFSISLVLSIRLFNRRK